MSRTVLALLALTLLSAAPAAAGDASLTGPINVPPSAPTMELKPADAAPPAALSVTDVLAIPSPLGDMALGAKDAPVTVVEYASMTCSHCAAFSADSFPKLKADYIDTGKVRYVFREFPLDIKAAAASLLVRCMAKGDSGRFFSLTEALFRSQDEWIPETADRLKSFARKEGLEQKDFEACFADPAPIAAIERTRGIAADRLNVVSTPTFFVNGALVKGNAWPEIEKKLKAAF